ncbi:hypothetical protein SVAN01_01495 [Stagonosporopsis vannaccii]|nr:hypothetical protein SVAN01_01495 [Stagonosporopsis vannaccii]
MAKKKKSKALSVRPKNSPYTSSPITLYFGVDRQRYYVQDALLKKLENLPVPRPWTFEIVFEDVDADTGHTLIHFLHAGAYQTLDKTDGENVEVAENEVVISEFQKAVRVSEAATKYGLPALQQLAQAEMDRRGTKMNLHDALRALSEDSVAKYIDENGWLQDYVSEKVRSAFGLESETFLGQDFFEQISSHTLTKILAKNVVNLYKERLSDLQKERMAGEEASPYENGGHLFSSIDVARRKTSNGPAPNAEAWLAHERQLGIFDETSVVRSFDSPDDSKATIPEADASRLSQQIADHAKDETRVETPNLILHDTTPFSANSESDKTKLALSDAKAGEPKEEEEVHPISQASVLSLSAEPFVDRLSPSASAVEDTVAGSNIKSLTKKEKKMLQKKMQTFTEPPDQPLVPNPEPLFDPPSVTAFQKPSTAIKELFNKQEEKKMKQRKFADEAGCLRTDGQQTTVRSADEVTSAAGFAEAFADNVVDMAEKKQDVDWSDWGSITTSSKKKTKKKRSDNCGFDIHIPATAEAEPESVRAIEKLPHEMVLETALNLERSSIEKEEDSLGEIWGGNKKKKKKGKRKATCKTPPQEPDIALDSDLVVPRAIDADAEDLRSTVQTRPMPGDDCPQRLGHLFEGDGWKDCKVCQAYMREMASKLHAAGLSEVTRFGVPD